MKRRASGFTLIEVLIVVVIIAILFFISFPAYQNYILRSKRAECQTVMLNYANAFERRYASLNTYTASTAPDPLVTSFTCPPSNQTQTYDLTVNIVNATPTAPPTFTITATPSGKQVKDTCGVLTLDHTGQKTPDVVGKKCW